MVSWEPLVSRDERLGLPDVPWIHFLAEWGAAECHAFGSGLKASVIRHLVKRLLIFWASTTVKLAII